MTATTAEKSSGKSTGSTGRVLVPLALAQFICSFAGSNMNVMISDISHDLHTDTQGVQLVITAFLLVMSALMIPGGKLTDKYGRKRMFMIGLAVYLVGTVISALSPNLAVLIFGNSILQGIGTAALIPPVYILTTLLFTDTVSRTKAFGVISAMAGLGSAAGPLIGGFITWSMGWRAAFIFQALVVALVMILGRTIDDPVPAEREQRFDLLGTVLSSCGLVLLVLGILAAEVNLVWTFGLIVAGALLLIAFASVARAKQTKGEDPLLSLELFHNRVSNLGLITQGAQWAMLLGASFIVSVFLQTIRGYDAIQTGLIFTVATVGLLASSLGAGRLSKRFPQRNLVVAGFVITIAGFGALLLLVNESTGVAAFCPGLLLIGLGVGTMLTPSVNIVQSAFPESLQGEISGLSRSVSNLGSSFGTALSGTILVAGLTSTEGRSYALAIVVLAVVGLGGLAAAFALPKVPDAAQPGVQEPVVQQPASQQPI